MIKVMRILSVAFLLMGLFYSQPAYSMGDGGFENYGANSFNVSNQKQISAKMAEPQGKEKCYPANKMREITSNNQLNDCTLCPIFRVVFRTISKISARASNLFSTPVKFVVLVAFAVWLAIYTLQFVATFETRDIKDYTQEIIIKGAQVMLVVVILNAGATEFYKWLINPVYETALDGATIAFQTQTGSDGIKLTSIDTQKVEGVEDIEGGLPKSMGDKIINYMVSMENNVREIKVFGSSLMCYSWENRILFIPKFNLLVSGIFFWIMAMAIIIIIPFIMVDVVFQLAVAVALLPPAIGCYPFRPTRQYSKKVWETFLNSAFAFLFTAIVVVMIISALSTTAETMTKGTGLTWNEIMTDTTGKMEQYADQFGIFQGRFIKFLFIFLLAWAVMNMGREFADQFASSISSTKIGGSIGTMAASSIKGAATKMAAPLKEHYTQKSKQSAKEFGAATMRFGERLRAKRASSSMDKQVKKGNATFNADGSTSYTKKRFFGLGGAKTYTRDAHGNTYVDTRSSKQVEKDAIMQNEMNRAIERDIRGELTKQGYSGAELENRIREAKAQRSISNYKRYVRTSRSEHRGLVTIKKMYVEEYTVNGALHTNTRTVSQTIRSKTRYAENLIDNNGNISKKHWEYLTEGLNKDEIIEVKKQIALKLQQDLLKKQNPGGKISSIDIYANENGEIITRTNTSKGVSISSININENLKPNENADEKDKKDGIKFTLKTVITDGKKAKMLRTDGIYNRVDNFKLNGARADELHNMDDILNKAERRSDGRIKSRSYCQPTAYFENYTKEEIADSELKLKDENVQGYFHGKDGGRFENSRGHYEEGRLYDKQGNVIAEDKKDEHGYQMYANWLGKQFSAAHDEEGKLRRIKGYDADGNPVLGGRVWTERKLISMKSEDGQERDLFIKNGLISDLYGTNLYGRTAKVDQAESIRQIDDNFK